MMTPDQMISNYFVTGTLPELPRDHFIDGVFVAADSGNRMESFDAGTGEAFAEFAAGSAADVDHAVASAAKGFEVWRNTPPARRCAILNEAARLLRGWESTQGCVDSIPTSDRIFTRPEKPYARRQSHKM